MTIYTSHEADGVDFSCSIVFDEATGPETIVGGTVGVNAINLVTGVKTVGTATVTSPNTIRCTFLGWSLVAGQYSIQVRAKPGVYAEQTVLDARFLIIQSASVAV